MKTRVLVTGASGRIGGSVTDAILKNGNFKVRVLLRDKPKNHAVAARLETLYGKSVEVLWGDVLKASDCVLAVDDVDYVLHFAAVVPPNSCHNPDETERTNYFGTKNLVDAIVEKKQADRTKFVEVGSMAEYGNRNHNHPWARVGDPLIPSYFDCYSVTKIRAERYVVGSALKYWLALRVGFVLYDDMMTDYLKDGLMFYTVPNAPIEAVTESEVVTLFRNMLVLDADGGLNLEFWKKIYDVGGGDSSRLTGFGLFEKGFAMMKSKPEKLLEPHWLPVRNFFTCWYADSDYLDDVLKFRHQSADSFFDKLRMQNPYFKLAKPLGKVIKKLVIESVLDTSNSPFYWVDNGMTDRVNAFFGGYDSWGKLPRRWNDYPLLERGEAFDVNLNKVKVDYDYIRDEKNIQKLLLDHGFNDKKSDWNIDANDMKAAAEFRGGKLLSTGVRAGDMHVPLKWECADKHVFTATAYAVLRAGYWCPECCSPAPWQFDRIAKNVPYYAQIWYDTHTRDEDVKLTASCYRDIPAEDKKEPGLPKDKIKKYRKG